MRKIVVAPDSFKDSLSAPQVAAAIEAGIRLTLPQAQVIKVPVADGGEGTMETLVEALGGEYVNCLVNDPLMRQIQRHTASCTLTESDGHYRSGLGQRPHPSVAGGAQPARHHHLRHGPAHCRRLHPRVPPRGDGHWRQCHQRCRQRDARGSGLSVSRRGGCRTETGRQIAQRPGDNRHQRHEPSRAGCRFTIICDVDNPLFGPSGAAYIFAHKKGLPLTMSLPSTTD